jgi:hypothetical protein
VSARYQPKLCARRTDLHLHEAGGWRRDDRPKLPVTPCPGALAGRSLPGGSYPPTPIQTDPAPVKGGPPPIPILPSQTVNFFSEPVTENRHLFRSPHTPLPATVRPEIFFQNSAAGFCHRHGGFMEYRSRRHGEKIRRRACKYAALVLSSRHGEEPLAPLCFNLAVFFEVYMLEGAAAAKRFFGPEKPVKLREIQ